ncbi:MAG: c-type cytochrome domain-containing protein [Planctomycetota bacterium]
MNRYCLALACLLLTFTAQQSARAASSEEASSPSGGLASRAKEILRARCWECHGGDSVNAGVEVLNYQSLIDDGWVEAGQPDASRLYEVMTSVGGDAMPPESRPPLSSEDIATVEQWITAGAAEFPADVPTPDASPSDAVVPNPPATSGEGDGEPAAGAAAAPDTAQSAGVAVDDRGVLAILLKHVQSLPADDRPFYRYFSSRHLLRSGATVDVLEQQRLALAKAINHLSREAKMVNPTQVDEGPGGTVFAVDIRQLGWHRRKLRPVDPKPAGKVADDQALSLFDIVLLEYPYSVFSDDDETSREVADQFLRLADQVRPIPFLRIDWFCSVALQPPLYHDLLGLPQTLGELEDELDVPAEGNLRDAIAKRAGITVSGVSRNNRIVERHPQSGGYYWKSHDFASNTGSENILVDPVDFVPSGGEMIFRLPNGAQGYYVSDAKGNRIDAAPTSIVTDKHASDRVVRNGLGCIRCHREGIKPFYDSVRAVLDVLPARPGFDKLLARRQYPGNDALERAVEADKRLFAEAMEELGVLVSGRIREPVTAATSAYLEQTISKQLAAAEIGLRDERSTDGRLLRSASEQLALVGRSPRLTRLGLAAFAAGGAIRRDAWEDNFDAAVRELGLGTPIVPVNGVLRAEYLNDPLASEIVLRSSKKNGQLEAGDKVRVFVENNSRKAIHIDLFGTGPDGKTARLGESGTKIAAGETFQFPPKGRDPFTVQSGRGNDVFTLYASVDPLPASVVFRGKNRADRVVHTSYVLESGSSSSAPRVASDAENIVKKSLVLETK